MGENSEIAVSSAEPWRVSYAHGCAWDQQFPALSLPDMFIQAVSTYRDRPLVTFSGRAYSYGAMLNEAQAFAVGLQKLGIGRGDRVGLFLPNVPIYVPAYYGALLAGATLVNFSPLYTAEELEAQVADSGARLIVTLDVPALLPKAVEVLRDSPLERLVVGRLADMLPRAKGWALRLFGRAQLTSLPRNASIVAWDTVLASGEPAPVAIDPLHDIALLQYTGGTTGVPKGAMLTHQNLTANARQLRAIDPDQGARDVTLGALPLFHVFANSCVLNRTVINGGCIPMLPRFDAGQVLAAIEHLRPTSMFAVPTMLQALLDHPRFARTDFSSLREVVSGGAPLSAPARARFEQGTGVALIEGYGLTESAGVVATNPLRGNHRGGTIGQPLPGTHIRLLDRDDPTRDARLGEPGELAVLGPQIMAGYWNRPEAAATAFAQRGAERWLRTGDIAAISADGYLRIVDRIKDMIAVSGFKVYPSVVEAALLHHPAVNEVLVIGVPDAYTGEVPRAYATLKGEVTGEELHDWLNHRVGKHERVDAVVVRDTLPKTAIGKLDRKALLAEVL